MGDPRIVNIGDMPWTAWTTADGVGADVRDPARKLGSIQCGLRLYRIAPGMQSTRMHRHLLQEEMFVILSGRGVLRHGDRRVEVKAGDFILYAAGDPEAHAFVNTGVEPLEYLATGNRVAHEVCEYPEDGTVYVEAIDKTLRNDEVIADRAIREAWFKAGR